MSTTAKPAVTHAQLVEVAARWLRRTRRCSVVLTELVAIGISEIPDAIGWHCTGGAWSILVEAKTSRADFRRDADKPHRGVLSDQSVGQERYYLAPKGILKAEDMPPGWGLIEYDGKRVEYVVKLEEWGVPRQPARTVAEAPLLLSALRRHQSGGINAATLAIAKLGRGELAIVRKVLERRERALDGLPPDDAADHDAQPDLPAGAWEALLDR